MYKKILIANDGSPGALKALDTALNLATIEKAALHMICVEELPNFPTTIEEVIEEKLEADHRFYGVVEAARTEAKSRQVPIAAHLVAGHPVLTIADFIEREGCDLLVIGYMGHSALYNRLIGSTTNRLVDIAPCPVLVVK